MLAGRSSSCAPARACVPVACEDDDDDDCSLEEIWRGLGRNEDDDDSVVVYDLGDDDDEARPPPSPALVKPVAVRAKASTEGAWQQPCACTADLDAAYAGHLDGAASAGSACVGCRNTPSNYALECGHPCACAECGKGQGASPRFQRHSVTQLRH
eukprot:m51a1_g2351 hypothetical protein (155) ;mRNA; f:589641-590293